MSASEPKEKQTEWPSPTASDYGSYPNQQDWMERFGPIKGVPNEPLSIIKDQPEVSFIMLEI